MFLKLKRDGVAIKDRGCADGRKYQEWLSKEDTSLSTVSTEGLVILCMIDTMEVWEVATDDTLEAFLQTKYDKGDIHIKLEGYIVTLLEEIDP